jgi:hypothetical protein
MFPTMGRLPLSEGVIHGRNAEGAVMPEYRVEALDVSRKYLFEASWSLSRAGQRLTEHGSEEDGTAEVGREAWRLSRQVEALKKIVRQAHDAATAHGERRS